MKFFLDSAKLDEIKYAYQYLGIDGVTTNPKHIKNSGLPQKTVLKNLAYWVEEVGLIGHDKFPISIEINPYIKMAREMVEAGREMAALSSNFVIKIPCSEQGIIASRQLEQEGIRTNVTLVFSPSQYVATARSNALFCSPFIGWKESNGENAFEYIREITNIKKAQNYSTQVLVAALRNGYQIAQAASLGADIVTCGLQVYQESFEHPYSDFGLNIFKEAWDQTAR